jgi:hypothetical protein
VNATRFIDWLVSSITFVATLESRDHPVGTDGDLEFQCLVSQRRAPSALPAPLQGFPGWWHHLDSTWLVSTPKEVRQVRSELGALLDSADRLLVVDVSGDAAAGQGFTENAWQWIEQHL